MVRSDLRRSPSTSMSIAANLIFIIRPPEGTFPYIGLNSDPNTGERPRNYDIEVKQVQVEDMRGREHLATLDTNGFQLYRRPTSLKSFNNEDEITRDYYPECIGLLRELTGANRVFIFDHTIRRRQPGVIDDSPLKRQPSTHAHIDQSVASAVARIHRHMSPSDVDSLLRKRFQIINLWRPINVCAFDWPLAFCDYDSLDPKNDLVSVKLLHPDWEEEAYRVTFNPNHRWKYWKGMEPNECVLLKICDSDTSVARHAAHCSFEDPSAPEDSPFRQSIEIRALVFYG